MASSSRNSKQRTTNKFRQKLNPAFAAAHGLSTTVVAVKEEEKKPSSSSSSSNKSIDNDHGLPPTSNKVTKLSMHRLDLILKNARSTGKLNASNSGLSCPFPDKLFYDLRLPVDLSMAGSSQQQSSSSSSYCYTEDTLTVIDLSDNSFEVLDDDIRFYVFKQIIKLRMKRSNIKQMLLNLSSDNFEFLQVIDLSGNQLQELNMDLLPSTSLIELHLQCNQLHTLKASSEKQFPNLALLDLSENKLSSTSSDDNDDDTTTTTTTSSNNNFDCFTKSTKLVTFRCSKNQLTTIPEFLIADGDGDSSDGCPPAPCDTLQILDLSHNQIVVTDAGNNNSSRFDFLTKYTKLHTINLSFNKLNKVPCINPMAVKHLQLNANKLTSLEGMFPITTTTQSTSSSTLIDLLLHDNYLQDELSINVIQQLTSLQRLDLSYNKLKNLPYQLGFVSTNLNSLKVMGNPLLTFKSSDIDNNNTRGILQTLRNRAPIIKNKTESSCSDNNNNNNNSSSLLLTSGILRQNSIHLEKSSSSSLTTSLPTIITNLVNELKEDSQQQIAAFDITGSLILDGNKLESGIVDPLFPLLPNITEISICDNLLNEIPTTLLQHCSRLKKLSLTKNRIFDVMNNLATMPQTTISWSKSLLHMDLSINRITEFPIEIIKQLVVLEVLNLSSNRIESTDSWDWLPPRLRILDLSDNRITNIDNLSIVLGACCQQSLQVISFANNDIRKIPYELGLLSKTCGLTIKHIDLKGNPQQMIRQSILLDKSCDEQLDYLYNRMTKEQREKALASMIRLVKKNKNKDEAALSSSGETAVVAENVNKNDIPTTTTTTTTLKSSSDNGSSPSPSRESVAAAPPPQQKQEENMNGSHDATATGRIASSQTSDAGMKGEEKVAVAADNPPSSSIHDDSTMTPTPPPFTANNPPPSTVAEAVPTPAPTPPSPGTSDKNNNTTDDSSSSVLEELKLEISNLESELETNFALSQAKRYAIKKSIAMARSKLIREERKLGLRK